MKSAILFWLVTLCACGSAPRQTEVPTRRGPGIEVLTMSGDDQYVIDKNTETCALVVALSNPTAIPVSCARLARNLPAAAKHMPWALPSERSQETEVMSVTHKGIKRTGPNEYEVTRRFVDRLNRERLGRGARVVPSIKNGVVRGFKLYAIRPSSVYAALGLKNGDTVLSIDEHDLVSMEAAVSALSDAKKTKTVLVKIERRGRELRLLYQIRR